MASRWPDLTSLGSPIASPTIRRSFEGYRSALSRMSVPDLIAELTRINAALESQRAEILAATLSRQPSESTSNLDSVLNRSIPPATPSSPRGHDSEASRLSPRPSSSSLPFASRPGARIAAGLAASSRRRRD